MKIAIVADIHFGARQDSLTMLDYYQKFFDDVFFPELERQNVETIIDLGDIFERRKYINFNTLNRAKRDYFDHLTKYNYYLIVGNHDVYYQNTNEINSPRLVLNDYKNIRIIEHSPETLEIGGRKILMVPWISSDNVDACMDALEHTNADLCAGHFAINGFEMNMGFLCHDGLDMGVFRNFDLTISGHFHKKSHYNNIHYLGNPFQTTWADYGIAKGFHLYETETGKLEFIQNPYDIYKIISFKGYNSDFDFEAYKDTYVKVMIPEKINSYEFEKFMVDLNHVAPLDVKIVEEQKSLNEDVLNSISDNDIEDTFSVLTKYIDGDSVITDDDKKELKKIMETIYKEAEALEV